MKQHVTQQLISHPDQHVVTADNAAIIWKWIHERDGVAIWLSINPSNPGGSWTTPVNTEDGKPYPKPNSRSVSEPSRIITDPADITVSVDKEVERFHIDVRPDSNNPLKVTDEGSGQIRSAVANAGEGAYHVYDYNEGSAVIMAPERQLPLPEYIASKP